MIAALNEQGIAGMEKVRHCESKEPTGFRTAIRPTLDAPEILYCMQEVCL